MALREAPTSIRSHMGAPGEERQTTLDLYTFESLSFHTSESMALLAEEKLRSSHVSMRAHRKV